MKTVKKLLAVAATVLSFAISLTPAQAQPAAAAPIVGVTTVVHERMKIGNVDLFYREAGDPRAPTVSPAARLPDVIGDVPQSDSGRWRRGTTCSRLICPALA